MNFKKVLLPLLCLLLGGQLQGNASALPEDPAYDQLREQVDWAMYLQVQDVPEYLNYKGSSLHPLTRVRVSYLAFGKPHRGMLENSPRVYEEFWYQNGTPVGLRRRSSPALSSDMVGTIVLGPVADSQRSHLAATNAMLRIIAELQLKQIVVSSVRVPAESFDAIGNDLQHYGFNPVMTGDDGIQMSIHLYSTPGDRDETYFFRK